MGLQGDMMGNASKLWTFHVLFSHASEYFPLSLQCVGSLQTQKIKVPLSQLKVLISFH